MKKSTIIIIVVVAAPDRAGVIRCVAGEPDVFIIGSGSGFSCHGHVSKRDQRSGSFGHDVLHGAGQKPGATTHFSWRNNNMSIYKAFNHQHVPEIRQSLKQTQGYLDAAIDFIPYRGDFARGIFATEVVKTDKPIEEIVAGYKEFYKDAKFTHYVDKAIDLKQVVNTNKCLVHVDKYGDKLLITSCIDNLLKGAVGQAVQNMNIMFGLDQTAGLKLKPSAF